MIIDRRGALALLGLGAAAPADARPAGGAGQAAFHHGVASGDPLQDRVILWTRITPGTPAREMAYAWRLTTPDGRLVKRGRGVTGPHRDYTAKVDVTGLSPGRDYLFQFEAGGATSPEGRTRTLPAGPVKDVVLAFATCSLFPNGYFNAYGAIADLPRVDAVIHLGDYIYEYGGAGSYGMDSPVAHERPHDPPHDCVSLADYRRRHAQYRTDPQLQAAHARAPWIVVWDDHETANDSWVGGAENHRPATEGDWSLRKAAAIKAYYEWMPIREPADHGFAIYRSFDFGDVASLFMLETRLTARDQQLTYGRDLPVVGGQPQVPELKARLADPSRRMMSPAQEAWLRDGLAASVRSGRPWQVLGNQVVMARVTTPSARKAMGDEAFEQFVAGLAGYEAVSMKQMDRAAALDLPWTLDMWDGYPADRQRLYGILEETRANCVVVSGDSHAFWANELYDAEVGGRRAAVEFGATAITSPGGGDTLRSLDVGKLFQARNREVLFNDQTAKGFVLLTLTREAARGELVAVSTIHEKAYRTGVLKAFRATPGSEGISGLEEVRA